MFTKAEETKLWEQMPPEMQEWFKRRAREYMGSNKFKYEKNRHLKRMSRRGSPYTKDLRERADKWFSFTLYSPIEWSFVTQVYICFENQYNSPMKNRSEEEEIEMKKRLEKLMNSFAMGWEETDGGTKEDISMELDDKMNLAGEADKVDSLILTKEECPDADDELSDYDENDILSLVV
jgi:hypothetical protein